jgi:hypothetical protein
MAGDQLNPADIENHTLVVIPIEFKEHVPTIHTKAGEQSPCIVVNLADLSAEGGVPVIYNGVMWFNVLLYNGLKRQIGQSILGRMVKGQAQTGKNAPWQLQDVMPEASWVAYADGWLNTPDGQAFEQAGQAAAANTPASAVQAPAPAAPPAAPPAPPAGPPASAAPAGPPAAPAGPPAAPAGPPAATPAPAAAPAAGGDLAASLAGLPATEVAAILAALSNQGQAAH